MVPCSSSSRAATASVARCSSRIISKVSSRVAPGAMAKLPETEPCSGELKNRHCRSPVMNDPICIASSTTAAASTG